MTLFKNETPKTIKKRLKSNQQKKRQLSFTYVKEKLGNQPNYIMSMDNSSNPKSKGPEKKRVLKRSKSLPSQSNPKHPIRFNSLSCNTDISKFDTVPFSSQLVGEPEEQDIETFFKEFVDTIMIGNNLLSNEKNSNYDYTSVDKSLVEENGRTNSHYPSDNKMNTSMY
ncbi:12616_t:CDS:2 [Dentiscutata erythropus]|uniref:12616_t:CDS:1 n=1 Tax=Dentiscutata erythropus TaxID=1348616 RepID=A0A9N8Z8C3_9GLOM|nr:12616_t:CDS:2 [Dentiscutata erythropus]